MVTDGVLRTREGGREDRKEGGRVRTTEEASERGREEGRSRAYLQHERRGYRHSISQPKEEVGRQGEGSRGLAHHPREGSVFKGDANDVGQRRGNGGGDFVVNFIFLREGREGGRAGGGEGER